MSWWRALLQSIRAKVMLLVLAATFVALFFTGTVLVLFDLASHRQNVLNDLATEARIIGRASAPALAFDDSLAAHQNLELLRVRPQIVSAAIYTREGRLFASYLRDRVTPIRFPPVPGRDRVLVEADRILLSEPIADEDERLGTVVFDARIEVLPRLSSYLALVALVLVVSLLLALLMSSVLQATVTQPILAIADVAKRVRRQRDFSLRVPRTTEDETGELVTRFNEMLAEIGASTRALEESHEALEHEMDVRADAEQALVEANRRKDDFLATLAHELRNPLGPIRNAVQYLRLTHAGSTDVQNTLAMVERQVRHMVRLIDDLLDISRITRDTLELRRSSFRLDDLMQDVVESSQHAVDEAGHELRVHRAGGNAWLYADRARLGQAVANLVNNAIKYTPPGGHIDVESDVQGRELSIRVRDDGIGIPPDKLAEVFEPFSQLDRSLEKTRGGLGIGLTLAQRLVALHDGSLIASSEGPGHGSTFQIRVPVVDPQGGNPPNLGGERAPVVSRAVESRRVLVADDNRDAAESLAALLRVLGHRATIAHDGVEALDLCEKEAFDVAVLDIGMPRLNGYDLARRLRELPNARTMRLVALTGWGQVEDRERAFAAGFDDHLTKPVQTEQLASLLAMSDGPHTTNGPTG